MALSHIVQHCPEPAAVNSKQLCPGTKKLGTRNPENIKKEEKKNKGRKLENIIKPEKNLGYQLIFWKQNFSEDLCRQPSSWEPNHAISCLPTLGCGQREHNGVRQSPQKRQRGNEPHDSQERGMRYECGSSGSGRLHWIPHENDLGRKWATGGITYFPEQTRRKKITSLKNLSIK